MIDAGDSHVILKWSKNHPEDHYLKIAIVWAAEAVASLMVLKIQLRTKLHVNHSLLEDYRTDRVFFKNF